MQQQGQKIKNIIKAKHLLQSGVARMAGISEAHFSKIVSGAPTTNETITRIAEILGVTPEYLMDTSRPFNLGDTIPEDAIAVKPVTTQKAEPLSETAALIRIIEKLAGSDSKAVEAAIQSIMKEVADMRGDIAEIKKNLKDGK